MKKSIAVLWLYILAHTVSAQSDTIVYDFKTRSRPTPLNKIKIGEFYKIKITSINQNLYKVSINSVDTSSSKPQATPTFGSLELDALGKVIAGISPLSTAVTMQQTMQEFKKNVSGLLSLTNPVENNQFFKDTINNQKVILDASQKELNATVSEIDKLKFNVYTLRLSALRLENKESNFNFINALTEINNIRKKILNLQTNSQNFKDTYDKFSSANKSVIEADDDPKTSANDKAIKDAYDKLLTTLTEAFASVSADKANELLSSLVLVENNKDNTYTSLPIQFMGEQAKVTISIVPRSDTYNLSSFSTQLIFPAILKTYTVVGLSYYGTNLHDEAYSSIETPTSSTSSSFSLKQEDGNKLETGLAALLRIGTKFGDDTNIGGHLSFGAGVSIASKIKPRLLLGFGISYGKKHMVALDVGGIVGYVDRKSVTIDLATQYLKKPDTVVVSTLGIGVFGSLGYMYQF